MNVINEDGKFSVTFNTQHNTVGRVELPATNEAEALRLIAEMRVKELETVSGVVDLTHQVVTQIVAGKQVTLMDAIEQWRAHSESSGLLSLTTIRVSYLLLRAWAVSSELKDKPITSITPQHVNAFVNRGNERRSTAIRKLTACRQLFSFCRDMGISVRNPASPSLVRVNYSSFSHEEKEARERPIFTEEEIERITRQAFYNNSYFWVVAITLGRENGLRLGDVAQLEWASIHDGRITVWTEKSNARVDMELSPVAKARIEAITKMDEVYCFPHERAIAVDPFRRAQLPMQFSRICEKASIKGKSFHCLRHTNATNLAQSGVPIDVIAERLGHSSTKTTEVYVHPHAVSTS